MKWPKYCLLIVILVFVVPFVGAYQYDVKVINDFSDWSVDIKNGQVTLYRNAVTTDYTDIVTSSTADAFLTTVTVENADCKNYCMASLSRRMGTYYGDDLSADVFISEINHQRSISFFISRYNRATGSYDTDTVSCFVGPIDEAWEVGKSLDIAIGIKGNELLFYNSNENLLVKVELWGEFIPYTTPKPYYFSVYTQTSGDRITVTLSNFTEVSIY